MPSSLSNTRPGTPFNTAATDPRPARPVARLPALLLIDIQKEYCDPDSSPRGNKETVAVSRKILSASYKFRAAGLPLYPIYFTRSRQEPLTDIDYYGFAPQPKDTIIQKNTNSAFGSTDIDAVLKHDGHTDLLVCGFNLNACVRDTVMDAVRHGFKVTLLRDLTGNDNWNYPAEAEHNLTTMANAGVIITPARHALAQLRTGGPGISA